MRRLFAISLLVALAACQREAHVDVIAHRNEVLQWRANRAKRLTSENGWLTLVGLHWLNEGVNQPIAGVTLDRKGDVITLQPGVGQTIDNKSVTAPVRLMDDAAENGPTIVKMGTTTFQVIKRGERYGLRVKDSQAPTRTHFLGLDYFDVDPKWRIEAHYEPYKPEKHVAITDVTGMTSDTAVPGALVFNVDGKEYRIDPIIEQGETDFFIIFKDATSRDATYPAARYLYASPPDKNGNVIVDFNKAYNPPCAFTSFATCPLPPPQNRLPFRIEAGEKKYRNGHA